MAAEVAAASPWGEARFKLAHSLADLLDRPLKRSGSRAALHAEFKREHVLMWNESGLEGHAGREQAKRTWDFACAAEHAFYSASKRITYRPLLALFREFSSTERVRAGLLERAVRLAHFSDLFTKPAHSFYNLDSPKSVKTAYVIHLEMRRLEDIAESVFHTCVALGGSEEAADLAVDDFFDDVLHHVHSLMINVGGSKEDHEWLQLNRRKAKLRFFKEYRPRVLKDVLVFHDAYLAEIERRSRALRQYAKADEFEQSMLLLPPAYPTIEAALPSTSALAIVKARLLLADRLGYLFRFCFFGKERDWRVDGPPSALQTLRAKHAEVEPLLLPHLPAAVKDAAMFTWQMFLDVWTDVVAMLSTPPEAIDIDFRDVVNDFPSGVPDIATLKRCFRAACLLRYQSPAAPPFPDLRASRDDLNERNNFYRDLLKRLFNGMIAIGASTEEAENGGLEDAVDCLGCQKLSLENIDAAELAVLIRDASRITAARTRRMPEFIASSDAFIEEMTTFLQKGLWSLITRTSDSSLEINGPAIVYHDALVKHIELRFPTRDGLATSTLDHRDGTRRVIPYESKWRPGRRT